MEMRNKCSGCLENHDILLSVCDHTYPNKSTGLVDEDVVDEIPVENQQEKKHVCQNQFCMDCVKRYFVETHKNSFVFARLLECPGKCGKMIPTMKWKELLEMISTFEKIEELGQSKWTKMIFDEKEKEQLEKEKEENENIFNNFLKELEEITSFRCYDCDNNHNFIKEYRFNTDPIETKENDYVSTKINLLNQSKMTIIDFVNALYPSIFQHDGFLFKKKISEGADFDHHLTFNSDLDNTHFWMRDSLLFSILERIVDPVYRVQIALKALKDYPRFLIGSCYEDDFENEHYLCWNCLSRDVHFGEPCKSKNEISTSSKSVKQCPKCEVYLQRTEGCLSVECPKCDHKMCWKCLIDQNLNACCPCLDSEEDDEDPQSDENESESEEVIEEVNCGDSSSLSSSSHPPFRVGRPRWVRRADAPTYTRTTTTPAIPTVTQTQLLREMTELKLAFGDMEERVSRSLKDLRDDVLDDQLDEDKDDNHEFFKMFWDKHKNDFHCSWNVLRVFLVFATTLGILIGMLVERIF